MLDQLASEAAAAWYNRLLVREDWARAALASFAGRTARIEAGPVALALEVVPGGTFAAGRGTPAVTIGLDTSAMARFWLDPDTLRRSLRIEGDAAFAQALADVLGRLRPDPVEDLARMLGDAPAERIAAGVRAAFGALRDTAARVARQGADYLVAENPLLVGKLEWDAYVRELGALLARLEALEARLRGPAADRGQR